MASNKTKKPGDQRGKLETLVGQSVSLPHRTFVRTGMKTDEGKPCMLMVSLIPLKEEIKEGDFVVTGRMAFDPKEIKRRDDRKGWLIEDVLKAGF